jgi:hypothetical protein
MQSPDSLRTVLDSVFSTPAYRWVEPTDPFATLRRRFAELVDWIKHLEANSPPLYYLVIGVLVVVLVALLVHIVWLVVQTLRAPAAVAAVAPESVERRDAAWYRQEADRLAGEARYREAVQADFLALVLTLDAWGAVQFHPSKTPAEYVSEPALRGAARDDFRALVRQLYRIVFGGESCDAATYREWRRHAAPERYAAAH